MRSGKLVNGAVALGLSIGLLSIAPQTGSASATLVMKVTGSGNYQCSNVNGTITFDPPLTLDGNSKKETVTSTDVSSGCSGGTPLVSTTRSIGTFKLSTNSCQSLESSSLSIASTITYPNGAKSSSFKGTEMIDSSSPISLSIKGKVTDSYPSSKAKSVIVIKQSESKIIDECESAEGVKSLTIKSGTSKNY